MTAPFFRFIMNKLLQKNKNLKNIKISKKRFKAFKSKILREYS